MQAVCGCVHFNRTKDTHTQILIYNTYWGHRCGGDIEKCGCVSVSTGTHRGRKGRKEGREARKEGKEARQGRKDPLTLCSLCVSPLHPSPPLRRQAGAN